MLPDQHLGRNTAYKMGVPLEQMVMWDPYQPYGGVSPEALDRARLILWQGHCSVHTRFSVKHIEQFRKQHPDGKVIVHPECTFDVVQAADDCGSTEHIIRTTTNSPEGSVWAVGTEIHLVTRLAEQLAPARTVVTLDTIGRRARRCSHFAESLLWALTRCRRDPHPIVVPEPTKTWPKSRWTECSAVEMGRGHLPCHFSCPHFPTTRLRSSRIDACIRFITVNISGLRQQPERRHREAREPGRKSAEDSSRICPRCPRTAHRRAHNGGGHEPLDVLADHGPRQGGAPTARSRRLSTARSAASTRSKIR